LSAVGSFWDSAQPLLEDVIIIAASAIVRGM
jgi:hypothetical protein